MAGPYLRIALEEAPNAEGGTEDVSSNVFWYVVESIEDDDGYEPLEEQDFVKGALAQMPHLGEASYEPKVKLSKVHPRPSNLGQLLYLTYGSCATTAGNGIITDPDSVAVPAGAYRHVYSFKASEPPQSAQLNGATGDGTYRKGTGIAVSELAFAFGDGGALECDADIIGLFLGDIPDPSLVPVLDGTYPLRRGDMTLEWLAASARTTDFDFKIANPVEAVSQLLVASLYPDLLQFKNDELALISGSIGKASVADADLDALRDGTQFAATIKIKGRQEIGSTGYYPTLWVELPGCQLVKPDREAIKAERRRQTKYDWEARYDPATGVYATTTLVNTTPAYATYA